MLAKQTMHGRRRCVATMNNFCIVSATKQSIDFVYNIWVDSFRGTAYENRQRCNKFENRSSIHFAQQNRCQP